MPPRPASPSRWNLALFPLAVLCGAAAWVVLVLAGLAVHAWRFPAPTFPGVRSPAGLALALLPPLLPALSLGAAAANALLWRVPPARRAMEAEASAAPRADYPTAQRDLLRTAGRQLLLAGLVMLAGALLVR